MAEKKKHLIIIDGNAIIHRAFHALPPLKAKDGQIVNAVYGFLLVFFKTIKDFDPGCVIATFDFPAATFRHQKYRLYKANRPKTPDDLSSQFPKIKEILESFHVPIFEKKGYEADDLIGTICKLVHRKQVFPKFKVIVLTGDLDLLQLVDDNTRVCILKKGVKEFTLYDEEKVEERYKGLSPVQLVDFRALRGDPSDNIPGVQGIGEKTAISLINEYKDLDNIYKEIDNIKGSLKEKLSNCKDQAYVSKMLAKINQDVPIEIELEKCNWGGYDETKIVKILSKYNFKTLISRLSELKDKEKVRDNLSLW